MFTSDWLASITYERARLHTGQNKTSGSGVSLVNLSRETHRMVTVPDGLTPDEALAYAQKEYAGANETAWQIWDIGY